MTDLDANPLLVWVAMTVVPDGRGDTHHRFSAVEGDRIYECERITCGRFSQENRLPRHKKGMARLSLRKERMGSDLQSYTNVYNGLLAVEVKAGKDTLSEDQQIVHAVLKMAGIPCYVLKPDEVPRKGQLHTRKLWSMREFEGLSGKIYQCMNEVEELQRQLEEKTTRLTELKDILDEATVMVEQTHFRLGRSIEGGNGAEKETGS